MTGSKRPLDIVGNEHAEQPEDLGRIENDQLKERMRGIINDASIVANYADVKRFERKEHSDVSIYCLNDNGMVIERKFNIPSEKVMDAISEEYSRALESLKKISTEF